MAIKWTNLVIKLIFVGNFWIYFLQNVGLITIKRKVKIYSLTLITFLNFNGSIFLRDYKHINFYLCL